MNKSNTCHITNIRIDVSMDLGLILNKTNVVPTKRKRSEDDTGPIELRTTPLLPQNWSRNSGSICDQCSQVNWARVPFLAIRLQCVNRALELRPINESHRQLAVSSCRICRILSLLKFPSLDQHQCVVYAKPLSRQSSSSVAQVPGSSRLTVLSIASKPYRRWPAEYPRCLVALTRSNDRESHLIRPSSINYDKLKCLARSCEENHGSLCTARSLYQVAGLRVIDVSSRMVVEAPENCNYLALSYVWGQQPGSTNGNALQFAPPLIEDAISVTIALEYNYLWVDRYDSPQEKHNMISLMDQVYANASVTIIAAAGDNVQTGLPGVSKSPRQPQEWVDIKNTTLLELPCGEDDLLSSKWASRGWTYQEGYLSKRRIIFTPHQVLFLCNKQYLEESGHVLLKDRDVPPFRLLEKLSSIFPTSDRLGKLSTSSILRQIEQYSMRDLSYPSDSFNAFRGILNYYTTGSLRGPNPVTHLGWGLVAEQVRSGQALSVHLDWYHQTTARRRHGFPSWAWTGWGGPLTFGQGIPVRRKGGGHSSRLPELSWEVSLEAEGGKIMEMYDFASICLTETRVGNSGLFPRSLESSPRRLFITCQVLPIHFCKVNVTKAQGDRGTIIESRGLTVDIQRPALINTSLAVLMAREGSDIGSAYHLDQDLKQKDCVVGLLFYLRHLSDNSIIQICCLLARQVEDGFYERVGLVRYMSLYPVKVTCSPMIFLDEMGSVIESIEIPERTSEQMFDKIGERKTICLL